VLKCKNKVNLVTFSPSTTSQRLVSRMMVKWRVIIHHMHGLQTTFTPTFLPNLKIVTGFAVHLKEHTLTSVVKTWKSVLNSYVRDLKSDFPVTTWWDPGEL